MNTDERDKPKISSDDQLFLKSWDQNLTIWFRNMTGATNSLGDVIREIAEKSHLQSRPMEVLDIATGIPFKGLVLQGPGIRSLGDYLEYGVKVKKHTKTKVNSTIISNSDWTKALLDGSLKPRPEHKADAEKFWIHGALMDTDNLGKDSSLLDRYNEKLRRKDISVYEVDNPLPTLNRFFDEGKRFDLVFIDPNSCQDKLAYLMSIQKILSNGGKAYLPIRWWRPRLHGGGIDEFSVFDETITINDKKVKLEEYLAAEYPNLYTLADFPGAKTLVIHGS